MILSEQEIREMCREGKAQFIGYAGMIPRPVSPDTVFALPNMIDAYHFHIIGEAVYTVKPLQEHYELIRDDDIRVLSKPINIQKLSKHEQRKERSREYQRWRRGTPTYAVMVY